MKNHARAFEHIEVAFAQAHTAAVHRQHIVVGGGRRHPVVALAGQPSAQSSAIR